MSLFEREKFYALATEALKPTLSQRDESASFSKEAWDKFAGHGLFTGVRLNGSVDSLVVAPYYNIARASLDLPFTSSLAAHGFVSMLLLSKFAPKTLASYFWNGLTDGTEIGAICNSEPGTSLQLKKMKAVSRRTHDGKTHLDFSKPCITNGSIGTVLITSLWKEPTNSSKPGLELFVLRPEEVTQKCLNSQLTGFRTGDTGSVEGKLAGRDIGMRRITGSNSTLDALKYCFMIERLIVATMAAGIAQGVEDLLVEAARAKSFHEAKSEWPQYLQEKLVSIHVVRTQMNSLIETVLSRGLDRINESSSELGILKLMITDQLRQAVFSSIEFLGHKGVMKAEILPKVLRDLEMCAFFGGTRELQKTALFHSVLESETPRAKVSNAKSA